MSNSVSLQKTLQQDSENDDQMPSLWRTNSEWRRCCDGAFGICAWPQKIITADEHHAPGTVWNNFACHGCIRVRLAKEQAVFVILIKQIFVIWSLFKMIISLIIIIRIAIVWPLRVKYRLENWEDLAEDLLPDLSIKTFIANKCRALSMS